MVYIYTCECRKIQVFLSNFKSWLSAWPYLLAEIGPYRHGSAIRSCAFRALVFAVEKQVLCRSSSWYEDIKLLGKISGLKGISIDQCIELNQMQTTKLNKIWHEMLVFWGTIGMTHHNARNLRHSLILYLVVLYGWLHLWCSVQKWWVYNAVAASDNSPTLVLSGSIHISYYGVFSKAKLIE